MYNLHTLIVEETINARFDNRKLSDFENDLIDMQIYKPKEIRILKDLFVNAMKDSDEDKASDEVEP